MSEKPNQLWEIDLVGNIQEKGYGKYIFVAIDHFSKLVEIRVIKEKTAEAIYRAIKNPIINKNCIPERIVSEKRIRNNSNQVHSLKERYNFN
jgi:hypothetical protein